MVAAWQKEGPPKCLNNYGVKEGKMMKPNRNFFISLAMAVIAATVCCKKVDERNLEPVSWTDIRAEIANYICVVVDTLPDGSVGHWFKHGCDERCVDEATTTRLDRAVKKALDKAKPLLIGIKQEYVGFTYDSSIPIEESNIVLQEAYLSSDIFLRPILTRLRKALATQGLVCHDLPVLEGRPLRTVAWEELASYITAYAWPDEVHTPRDENGNPTGKTKYTFHICIGLNGISEMIPSPDKYLTYVGFTFAMNTAEFRELAYEHFKDILEEEEFKRLTDDDAQTQYLRAQLPQRLAHDKRLFPAICEFLTGYLDDLHVRLDAC